MNALTPCNTFCYAKKCAPVLLFFFLLISTQARSQQVISVQGNEEKGDQMHVSWTIGESIIETKTQNEISLTQGFHQPMISIERVKLLDQEDMNAHVYPNPTTGQVRVEIDQESPDFSLEILDVSGKRQAISQHNQNMLDIDLSHFASGLYLLKIQDKSTNKEAVFKIEKQ